MSARAWAGFLGLSVLWGIPYLFIKIAVDDGVPPIFIAWARVTMGAVVLLLLAWRAGTLDQVRGKARWIAAYAVLEICIPFPLIGLGEQHVSSSLTAILVASVPTFIVLLSLRFIPSERLNRSRALGLVVGFVGVVALVGIDIAGETDELLGAGAILLASFGYACGPMIYQLRFTKMDVNATMGLTLAIASLFLLPLALLDPPDTTPTAEAVVSLIVLGLFCTVAAFTLFAVLLADIGAARVSIITYVAPIVAVILGIIVLGEKVGPGMLVGLVLILGGSWLATGGSINLKVRRTGPQSPS